MVDGGEAMHEGDEEKIISIVALETIVGGFCQNHRDYGFFPSIIATMVGVLRHCNYGLPEYDYDSEFFTIELHHRGEFRNCPVTVYVTVYVGGKVVYFDYCDLDKMSLLELVDCCEKLGYEIDMVKQENWPKFYSKMHGCTLSTGLLLLGTDQIALSLTKNVKDNTVIEVYVKHSEPMDSQVTSTSTVLPKNVQSSGRILESENTMDKDSDGSVTSKDSIEVREEDGKIVDSDYPVSDDEVVKLRTIEVGDLTKVIDAGHDYDYTPNEVEVDSSSDEEGAPKMKKKPWKKISYPQFNESMSEDPSFELGQCFASHLQLREAIRNYACKNGKSISFTKMENRRVRAVCCEGDCPWVLYASYMYRTTTLQVKTLKPEHTCSRTYEVDMVNYRWIARRIKSSLRSNPKWPVQAIADTLHESYNIEASKWQIYRAKKLSMEEIEGNCKEQYEKLWSYRAEVLRSNPNTTFDLEVQG
ncbi:hypothetical protein RJ640_012633, partial [Escallonia rubra]